MKKITLLLLSFIFIFLPSISSANINDSNIKAVVQVKIWDSYTSEYIATGSGIVIDGGMNMLTNYHVVEDAIGNPNRYLAIACATKSSLSISDCRYVFSTYDFLGSLQLKAEKELDLAILNLTGVIENNKIKSVLNMTGTDLLGLGGNIKISIYGEELTGIKVGDQVQTLGYPGEGGDTITYSNGAVTNFEVNKYGRVLRIVTDARITHGSSGGAAFDLYGKFIGVTTEMYTDSSGNFISGFIIPVSTVNWWMKEVQGYRVNNKDEYTISEIPDEVTDNALCLIGSDQYWDKNSKTCVCSSGYARNSSGICVKEKSMCPEGFVLGLNKCVAIDKNCADFYGPNVDSNGIFNGYRLCGCVDGYEWNMNGTACIKSFEVNSEFSGGGGGGGYTIPEGALIRAIGDIDVYIVKYVGSKKFKRLVLSPSVFNNYGHLKWENILDIDRSTVDSFTTSDLVRAAGDNRVYRLYPSGDTGQKRLVKNNNVLAKYGLDSDSVYEINSFDRDSYIEGSALE